MAQDLLIVEDDAGLQQMLGQVVTALGIPYRTADDAAEAMAQVRREWPQLVLLDMKLPHGVDGWMVWDQMLAESAGRRLYVVTFSANMNAPEKALALRRGALAVMDKDQSFVNLATVLRQAYQAAM
jgi:two-component system OmpR family response regulator